MDLNSVMELAKKNIGDKCKVCPVCDGRACKNMIPGPGAKGIGDTAIRNYQKWKEIRINMDNICENLPCDTGFELFGRKFKYPIFAGPVGAVNIHYGDYYNDLTYNDVLVKACVDSGILAFTGDGVNPDVMISACKAISSCGGLGIPTVKPWNMELVKEKIELCKKSNAFAIAMDIDASGLPFLKNMNPPAGAKTVDQLKEIVSYCEGTPFILKGIMTKKGALKAIDAGASAIIVSNHGGRVLDQCPSTAEVLKGIKDAVGDQIKVLVDGGLRSGVDIFKALALGADACVVARPYVNVVYGAAEEGVKLLTENLGSQLADTMSMCGVHSLDKINEEYLFCY